MGARRIQHGQQVDAWSTAHKPRAVSRRSARRAVAAAALAPALLLPAGVTGLSTTLFALPQAGKPTSRLPGPINALTTEAELNQVGASGQLPRNEEPSPELLRGAEQPEQLSTGAGPLTDLPSGSLGIPEPLLRAYFAAADRLAILEPSCGVHWSVLASIGRIESGHARSGRVDAMGTTALAILGPRLNGSPGTAAIPDTDGGRFDGDPVWDRAVGPMQFIPSTWMKYAADGNGDGEASPHNINDAALAAGKYLCASGTNLRDPQNVAAAIFSYNHSESYVRTVLIWAAAYARGVTPTLTELSPDTRRIDILAGHRMRDEQPGRERPESGHRGGQREPDRSSGDQGSGDRPPKDDHPGEQPPDQQPPGNQPPGNQPPGNQPPGGPPPLLGINLPPLLTVSVGPVLNPLLPASPPAPPAAAPSGAATENPPPLPENPPPPSQSADPFPVPPADTSAPPPAPKPSASSKPSAKPRPNKAKRAGTAPSTAAPAPATSAPAAGSPSSTPSSAPRPCPAMKLSTGEFVTQDRVASAGTRLAPLTSNPNDVAAGQIVFVESASGPLSPCTVPEGTL